MIQRTLQEKIASVLNGKKAVTIMGAATSGKIHFAKNDVKRQD